MREQQEIELDTIRFPIARRLAVVLFFDDDLFRLKARKLKEPHDFKGEWLNHSVFAGIAHKYGAELVLFQNTMTFLSDLSHFKQIWLNRKQRKIAVNVLAVMDNIGIRRVRANQIHRLIGQVKFPRVTLLYLY